MNKEGGEIFLFNRKLSKQIDESITFPVLMTFMLLISTILAIIVGIAFGEILTDSMVLTYCIVTLMPIITKLLILILDF